MVEKGCIPHDRPINSYILYKLSVQSKQHLSHKDFRIALAKELLLKYCDDNPFLHQLDLPKDIFQREMKYLQLESQHSSTALYAALKKKMDSI